MRRYRWQLSALLLVVVLAASFVFLGGPDDPPAPRPPDGAPRVLVALGDSTISGEGAGDYEPGTDGEDGDWCHRSANAAIHRTGVGDIAETINLACSGAPSEQVGLGDVEQYTEGSQARRLGEIARDKRVVAIQLALGANDEPKFSHVLDGCVRAWFDQGQPGCGAANGDWASRVDAMVPKAVRAIGDIRSVMLDAGYQAGDYQLILQSYAAPVGPGARAELLNLNGCPLRSEDLDWVSETAVPVMTEGVRRVARETGVRFLDLSRAGIGREACSREDPAQEWFARLAVRWEDLGHEERFSHALQESFHPNAAGHAQIGRCLGEFIGSADPAAACLVGGDGNLHAAPSRDAPRS
ncbi:GDSL-type esterase/lipase family protein [Actinokineospora pegani]|uniref:GDSL-type esterase/lipase family protein n=1 Tax=Actinokineospora pegani TaxID=2654637 RepID=UPI0012E9E038|nr:GDSL-type esterase/lipase family protein [Actinokineospora pegani]